jgi:hypothetical protein
MTSSSASSSVSSSLSSSSPIIAAVERQLLLNEYALLNPDYAYALDQYFQTNNNVLQLISAFHSADAAEKAAEALNNSTPTVTTYAREIMFNQRKLKNSLLTVLGRSGVEEALETIICKGKGARPPTPATFRFRRLSSQTNPDLLEGVTASSPHPSSPEQPSCADLPEYVTPSPSPISPNTENILRTMENVSPLPVPAYQSGTRSHSLSRTRRKSRQKKKRSTIFAAGLSRVTTTAEPSSQPLVEPTSSPERSPLLVQPPMFICRLCSGIGHLQKGCTQYFCRVCREYEPGHYSNSCPSLAGRRILPFFSNKDEFFTALNRWEELQDMKKGLPDRPPFPITHEDYCDDPVYWDNTGEDRVDIEDD